MELKYFHFAQFLLNAHQAANWHLKNKTENLKFSTDLKDHAVNGWSVLQKVIVFRGRLLKLKIEACPVNTGHYIAFKHHNDLQEW